MKFDVTASNSEIAEPDWPELLGCLQNNRGGIDAILDFVLRRPFSAPRAYWRICARVTLEMFSNGWLKSG
jgi:hypothetical protein